MWLLRVAELFSCNFQTVVHFAEVVDCLGTIQNWLLLDNVDNTAWITHQQVEMSFMKCASEFRKAWILGRQGKKNVPTELQECAGNKERSSLPVLPNTLFMVVIHWVSNGTDIVLTRKLHQISYTDLSH